MCRWLAALLLCLALPVWAGEPYTWPTVGVVDGDTIKVRLPGLPQELQPVQVRLRGLDTPETGNRAKCEAERVRGERATAFLEAALRSGQVTFSNLGWDRYGGRIDATVRVNGQDVADLLIEARLGRAYDGGRRDGWC